MSDYIICLVQFEKSPKHYLFQAPNDWRVRQGAYCKVEGSKYIGLITNTMRISTDYETDIQRMEFVLNMNENRPLKKVTHIVSCETLEDEDVSE